MHAEDQIEHFRAVLGIVFVRLFARLLSVFNKVKVSVVTLIFILSESVRGVDACVEDGDFDPWIPGSGRTAHGHHLDDFIGSFHPLRRMVCTLQHSRAAEMLVCRCWEDYVDGTCRSRRHVYRRRPSTDRVPRLFARPEIGTPGGRVLDILVQRGWKDCAVGGCRPRRHVYRRRPSIGRVPHLVARTRVCTPGHRRASEILVWRDWRDCDVGSCRSSRHVHRRRPSMVRGPHLFVRPGRRVGTPGNRGTPEILIRRSWRDCADGSYGPRRRVPSIDPVLS